LHRSVLHVLQQADSVGGDAQLFSGETEFFLSSGLDIDAVGRRAERGGKIAAHLRNVRGKLGGLCNDRCIDIADAITGFVHDGGDGRGQFEAVSSGIGRIGVGEVAANVTLAQGAEDGIHYGMGQHIGIRVAEQAGGVRDIDPAEDEPAALHQAVHIVTVTDSHASPSCSLPFSCFAGFSGAR